MAHSPHQSKETRPATPTMWLSGVSNHLVFHLKRSTMSPCLPRRRLPPSTAIAASSPSEMATVYDVFFLKVEVFEVGIAANALVGQVNRRAALYSDCALHLQL